MRPPNIVPYVKRALFAPTEIAVTALVVAIYAAVLISSVIVYETVPTPPEPHLQRGLDLDQAWKDLQQITREPHPYNSHSNGQVREYLLHRLRKISHAHPNVEIADDLVSNGTYIGRGQVVYFEGENLLVKIEGEDPTLSAVLFSAHFDSVSTGLGATDDGMGVVTLLQLIGYYGRNQPKRTVVFNINNGEEDWLNGAHAFLDHPWAKLPKTFLNLEGAGNGGRPLLFRTSSFDVTAVFRGVSRPHGSSLSNDAFKRGLIRSGTDFSVYEEAGMRGLDLAFYRRRARYHTVFDSSAWLGNQNSLWLMMENALEAGNALISAGPSPKSVDAVYFDIYGSSMAVISRHGMLALNVILLILGPLFVVAIVMTSPERHNGLINRLKEDKRVWIHAPVRLVVTFAVTLGLAAIFGATNKYIIYSSSYVVAVSLISIAILGVTIPAKIVSFYFPSPDPLLTTANHAVFTLFWWIILCVTTGALNEGHLGGFYYATFAYAGQLFSLLLSLGTMLHFDDDSSSTQLDGVAGDHLNGNHENGDNEVEDGEDVNEQTSLLRRAHRVINRHLATPALGDPNKSRSTWSAEILFSLLFPAILSSAIMTTLLTALAQTPADGNPAKPVYLAIGFISVLLALPIAPVAHHIHRAASFFLVLILVGTAVYNFTAFPFSPLNPLKTYVQQTIDLDSGVNMIHLTTLPSLSLYGHGGRPLWALLPSTQKKTAILCGDGITRVGLTDCSWSSLAPNVTLDSTPPSKWVKSSITKLGPNVARFKIQGRNTRSCRIYSDVPMNSVRVVGGHWEGVEPKEEFKEIRLWSRTWDKPFEVLVSWPQNDGASRTGKIACEWAEWADERIPAIDELRMFLPPWTVVSKLNDGLVEGTRRFEV